MFKHNIVQNKFDSDEPPVEYPIYDFIDVRDNSSRIISR